MGASNIEWKNRGKTTRWKCMHGIQNDKYLQKSSIVMFVETPFLWKLLA